MIEIIKVGMADLKISKSPNKLTTLGLGSCVGVALYDPITKIGGLAHIMLPDSTQIKRNTNLAKFADTGIIELLHQMNKVGVNKERIVAKIAGGAQMFEFQQMDEPLRIGTRNILAVKRLLKELSIPLIASDTGSNYGRTVEFDLGTGKLKIKTIGHGVQEI